MSACDRYRMASATKGRHLLNTIHADELQLITKSFSSSTQVERFVTIRKPTLFDAFSMYQFLLVNNLSLLLLKDINKIYGRGLIAFLLIGLPTNAILVMLITFHPLSATAKL